MRVLVTGGTGFIGSHTAVSLIEQGHEVLILDNLMNSNSITIDRIEQITGKRPIFIKGDVADTPLVTSTLKNHAIEAVLHFAALKAVGESVAEPLRYYQNNVGGMLELLKAMQTAGVRKIIFSSSATVYGDPQELPITEKSPTGQGLTNPYGKNKYVCEQILQDVAAADKAFEATLLRYFNPIGAHKSGLLGENPKGTPNNLLPYISQVAAGWRKELQVFGNDYDTPDGTGVRDYIHVVDLAEGHVKALEHSQPGASIYNLGTGKGTSVLELLHAFEAANNIEIPYTIMPRRPGDIASCYADPSKAEKKLGWKTTRSVEQACGDAWRAQQLMQRQ